MGAPWFLSRAVELPFLFWRPAPSVTSAPTTMTPIDLPSVDRLLRSVQRKTSRCWGAKCSPRSVSVPL